ncbi:SLOG family protein [Promicromonospora vindobonensis]|uniref:SLOG family protein n=1 Tax=Promicromonospora vindobonensis TaxID=195748 RepID=A0ABW5VTM0_9MICO
MPGKISDRFSHVVLVTGARTWTDEPTMRSVFREAWRTWGAEIVVRPLLLSGNCDKGADAMAERLWRDAGFEVLTFPADWSAHDRPGLRRNQHMVDVAGDFLDAGASVLCTAFLDLCRKPACPRRSQEQLLPAGPPGHFSHGTVHCRSRALAAGLQVLDAVPSSVSAR